MQKMSDKTESKIRIRLKREIRRKLGIETGLMGEFLNMSTEELSELNDNISEGTMETFTAIDVQIENIDESWDCEHSGIEWNLEFEMRNWGVKGINIVVPDQQIKVYFEKYNEEKDEDVSVEKSLHITGVKVRKEVEGDELQPDSIQLSKLEFYKGEWTATFAF